MKTPRTSPTVYVDGAHADASDTNPGTADHPFKTILRGIKALKPGMTLQIRRHLYRENLGEVRLAGTAEAPMWIAGEDGVILRPTVVPVGDCTLVSGEVYRIPCAGGARVVETDAAAWTPILVNDPNGVHFYLEQPVPSHPVEQMDQLADIPGSSWYNATDGCVLVHPYGSIDHAPELLPQNKISFRCAHLTIRDLEVQWASLFQLYQCRSVKLQRLRLNGTPLQLNSSLDCTVDDIWIEQVIKRGDTLMWYQRGEGSAMTVMDNCTRTTVRNVTARHGWNGPGLGGTNTLVDGVCIYGFPNHPLGVSGTDNEYSHIKVYRGQEGLFLQNATNVTLHDCEIERALVLGGGHTLTGKPATGVTLRRNTILSTGMINASDDSTIAMSDENYWLTSTWDWRYQNQRVTSLEDIRSRFGFELHSVWDNRMLPR